MFRKTAIVSILLVALSAGITLGQGRRNNRQPFGERMIQRLQRTLNLTESQMNGIRALDQTRRAEMEATQLERRTKREAVKALMDQPNPDPTVLGRAMLEMRETREKVRTINERFRSGINGLLTPEQQLLLRSRQRPQDNPKNNIIGPPIAPQRGVR